MDGGNVNLIAGNSTYSSTLGGSLHFLSGSSERYNSGNITLSTAKADVFAGSSGKVKIET